MSFSRYKIYIALLLGVVASFCVFFVCRKYPLPPPPPCTYYPAPGVFKQLDIYLGDYISRNFPERKIILLTRDDFYEAEGKYIKKGYSNDNFDCECIPFEKNELSSFFDKLRSNPSKFVIISYFVLDDSFLKEIEENESDQKFIFLIRPPLVIDDRVSELFKKNVIVMIIVDYFDPRFKFDVNDEKEFLKRRKEGRLTVNYLIKKYLPSEYFFVNRNNYTEFSGLRLTSDGWSKLPDATLENNGSSSKQLDKK